MRPDLDETARDEGWHERAARALASSACPPCKNEKTHAVSPFSPPHLNLFPASPSGVLGADGTPPATAGGDGGRADASAATSSADDADGDLEGGGDGAVAAGGAVSVILRVLALAMGGVAVGTRGGAGRAEDARRSAREASSRGSPDGTSRAVAPSLRPAGGMQQR